MQAIRWAQQMRNYLIIMRREFYYMWQDRVLRYVLIIGPVLAILFFSYLYSFQNVTDIPSAVVDLDHSAQSRELIRQLSNAENLKIENHPETYKELESLIDQGIAAVGIVIPENYGQDIMSGKQTRILGIIDGSNMIYATNASSTLIQVTGMISAETGIKTMVGMGMNLQEATEAYQAIEFKEEAWYNPTLNYAYFLILALALNMWQQCCVMAAAVNIIGETGVKSWPQVKASGFSKWKFFLPKSLMHLIIFMALVLPIYYIGFVLVKLPLCCSFGSLMGFTLVFALAIHSMGTMMSSLTNNAVDSTRFGMIVALPSFILCGYTWPLESMPAVISKAAWILPQTWFFQGFNHMTFKGAEFHAMKGYYLGLLIITVVCYAVSMMATARSER